MIGKNMIGMVMATLASMGMAQNDRRPTKKRRATPLDVAIVEADRALAKLPGQITIKASHSIDNIDEWILQGIFSKELLPTEQVEPTVKRLFDEIDSVTRRRGTRQHTHLSARYSDKRELVLTKRAPSYKPAHGEQVFLHPHDRKRVWVLKSTTK